MWAAIGTFIGNFFLNKVWNLLAAGFYTLLALFVRSQKAADNAEKLDDAIESGKKDDIAQAGEDALNGK